jgi:hypothetical protein
VAEIFSLLHEASVEDYAVLAEFERNSGLLVEGKDDGGGLWEMVVYHNLWLMTCSSQDIIFRHQSRSIFYLL